MNPSSKSQSSIQRRKATLHKATWAIRHTRISPYKDLQTPGHRRQLARKEDESGSIGAEQNQVTTIFGQSFSEGVIRLPPLIPAVQPRFASQIFRGPVERFYNLDLPHIGQALKHEGANESIPRLNDLHASSQLQALLADSIRLACSKPELLAARQSRLYWTFESHDGTIVNGTWTAWHSTPSSTGTSGSSAPDRAEPVSMIPIMVVQAVVTRCHHSYEACTSGQPHHDHPESAGEDLVLSVNVERPGSTTATPSAKTRRPKALIRIPIPSAADRRRLRFKPSTTHTSRAKEILESALDAMLPLAQSQSDIPAQGTQQPGIKVEEVSAKAENGLWLDEHWAGHDQSDQYTHKAWYGSPSGDQIVKAYINHCADSSWPVHSDDPWRFCLEMCPLTSEDAKPSADPTVDCVVEDAKTLKRPFNLLRIHSASSGVLIEVSPRFDPVCNSARAGQHPFPLRSTDLSPILFASLNLLDKQYLIRDAK